MHARRQDSVTRGAEINLGGAQEVYLCKFKSGDQTKKVKTKKKKKNFSSKIFTNPGFYLKILQFFTNPKVKTPIKKKKRSSSQKFHEIQCESTKTTKKQFLLANSRAISTNLVVLGLDSNSSSLEPFNFFGVQSLLGEHKQSFGGGHGPGMHPVAPGLH